MDFLMDVKLYLCLIITSFVIADDIGSETTLTCKNVGAPYVLWQKQGNDRYFYDLPKNESKYFRQYTTQMTIKNLTSSDSGTFRCRLFWKSKQSRYSADIRLYVVDKGTNLTLKCKDEPQRHPSYIWETNKLNTSFKTQTLILQEIRYQDAGTYRCKYYWPGSQWHNGIKTVIVVQDMKLPQLSTPNTKMLAAIGSDIVLACIVDQTRPQTRHVWWTKLNDERQTNISDLNLHRYHGGTFQKPSLKILNVTLNDSAEYRCYGGNTNGNNYAAMQLITGYPPVVNIKQECYVLRVGDNVTIGVIVKHAPLGSTIQWKQERNYIYTSYRKTIGELRNPYLTIRNVELKDAGNYTLYVQNAYGHYSTFTRLKVVYAAISGYKGYHELEKKANESFTLKCVVSGGTTVTWRQNGKQLKGVNQLSLQINKITRVNKGNYTCETNLETVTVRSSILHLDVKDIPWVSLPHETKEVIKGSDTVLDCSYDSYPKPTKIYWKKDDDIIRQSNTFRTTYNDSSVEISVLVLHDINQRDAGNYVCVVENSIGTGYSKILQITIKDTPSSERKENAYTKPLIISLSLIGTILVFVGLMVCYKRRQRNSSHYESPDFKQGDVHRYSTARKADEYDLPITTDDVNTLRTSGSLDKINELKGNRAFTVNEFLQLFNDTDKFKRHIQLEFQNLTESYNTNQSGGEYYNETASFMTHKNPPEHSTYLNTALTMNENCTLFISSVPQSNSIGQFWKFVSKNGVEQIILLNKENQQVAEFYPVSDKAIEMKYLRLELDSSEKKNKNLFLFHLQLKHQDRKSSIPVKIYKTTNWKEKDNHLPLEVLSQLLDVTRSSKSKSALLMTNDELDICMAGILTVCADVFRAIDESTSFSVFQLAKEARTQHPKIFLEITDYELCYLLIQHHLESNHLYDAID